MKLIITIQSKGILNINHLFLSQKVSETAKRRYRKHWKDIELVNYMGTGYHLWHNFPFDEVATEALPGWEEWEAIDYIQEALKR